MPPTPLQEIPRASSTDRRRIRRIHVSLPIEVVQGADKRLGRLTDLSRAGGQVADFGGEKLPGEALVIRRNGIELHAIVVWARTAAVGVIFPEPLDERTLLQIKRLG
jgi:hypothetical protein